MIEVSFVGVVAVNEVTDGASVSITGGTYWVYWLYGGVYWVYWLYWVYGGTYWLYWRYWLYAGGAYWVYWVYWVYWLY